MTSKYAGHFMAFLGALAEALGSAGQVAKGLVAIDETLARSNRTEGRSCVGELLRIKGELALLEGAAGCGGEEDLFLRALDLARDLRSVH